MKIARKYTKAGQDVFGEVAWTTRSCRISNLDGSVVFEMNDAQVPSFWSQLATDIIVSKYFRKAGVPQVDPKTGEVLRDEEGKVITGPEKSAKQVIHRMVGCWRHWGEKQGYFDTAKDGEAFYDELAHMLLHQMAAPNSPQWFNSGLNWSYGISGPAQGHWVTDPVSGETHEAEDAYSNPQPHACFIQSIKDDLVNSGGIMDLWVREARLFKYGSGTGSNFSKLRGEEEPLSGGGKSSGLMSWLKIGDRAAGAIKSGGTTRRAAKMVCLDLDHPDVESFINWKVREELKVAALVEGMKHLNEEQKACAKKLGLEMGYDFNGEAYQTVSGQNSNNSVRIGNEFFRRLDDNSDWDLVNRVDGKVAKTVAARGLWDQLTEAAWHCADPGVQFDTTINEWHTCPESGRINASNPCSEYMFLDNTACNLASLNLLKFFDAKSGEFDLGGFEHATRLWTVVLEVSVMMAAYPSKRIARLSYEYRTLGLGYANIGAMLMQAGIAYDSDQGRAVCGAITAILTGRSYATSAEMAGELGAFTGYFKNRDHMLRVVNNHRRAAYGVSRGAGNTSGHELGVYEGLEVPPVGLDAGAIQGESDRSGRIANAGALVSRARAAWDDALNLGNQHGYRNAQVSVIAPTGTIGLLMDCDTTGVEPDYALIKFKKLAGGGYFKIANQSLRPALVNLGYDEEQVKAIMHYVLGTLDLEMALPGGGEGKKNGNGASGVSGVEQTFGAWLRNKGVTEEELKKVHEALPTVFELQQAFSVWVLGAEAVSRLGLEKQSKEPGFSVLSALGLKRGQIELLNRVICGSQTVEGAPHLKDDHLPVFDCANTCGPEGKRFIKTEGHIRMMAAAQPFISGAISKTINLPNWATVDDIKSAYRLSWELGLKANALYRDGCKLSQPLNTKADSDQDVVLEDAEDELEVELGKEEVAGDVAAVAGRAAGVVDKVSGVGEGSPEEVRTVEKIVERIVERPLRRRLPDTRKSITHKFSVAGHEGYLTVGLYQDGSPGELFITMAKEGSTIGGVMDSLGTAISVALQYGVPIESLVNKFTHQRFEPAGMTHNPDIPFAKSLVDYIFRWMGMEFVPGYRVANAPRRSSDAGRVTGEAGGQIPAKEKAGASVEGNGGRSGSEKAANGNEDSPLGLRHRVVDGGVGHGSSGGGSGGAEERFGENNAGVLATAMSQMQADAPACDVCGTITVRNGTCYRCMNCGNSMGCS